MDNLTLNIIGPTLKNKSFQRDEGVDFKARLGRINASNAREQQRVKTD